MTQEICLDTETYSTVGVRAGNDRYMGAPNFACLLASYKASLNTPPVVWRVDEGEPIPEFLAAAVEDPGTKYVAHNAPFDRNALYYGLGIDTDIRQWQCTMAQAYAHGLPGSLETLGAVLGLPPEQQKNTEGARLIQLFCVPDRKGNRKATWRTHPGDWQQFVDYALQDAVTLFEIRKRLPTHNYVNEHLELFYIDAEINQLGFQLDMPLVEAAMKVINKNKARIDKQVEKLTDGRIKKATQREAIQTEIVGEYGLLMLDLQADTIKAILKTPVLSPNLRQLLELRLEGAMTSLAKYRRATEMIGPDGRMRYTLQYCGAQRTGRWAGRGFQPHNMVRPTLKWEFIEKEIVPAVLKGDVTPVHKNVNEACANMLRSTIIAKPGHELIAADWANIEGRILAWLAGEKWKLEGYRMYDAGLGPDSYVALYARSFGIAPENVTDAQRQMGKGEDLSMGYGGGVGAFVNVAHTYGLDLDELGRVVPDLVEPGVLNRAESRWERAFVRGEDSGLEPEVFIACDSLKQIWRRQHPATTQLWWDVERAVKMALRNPGSLYQVARCKIWYAGAWLIIELPSGRRLLYAKPQIKIVFEEDEETGEEKARDYISYMAANAKQWRRERSYGGKFVENIDQAIGNDFLRASLVELKRLGWHTVLHVHDDIANEEPKGERTLDELIEVMNRELPWSKGMPLAAAGYVSPRYRKD